MTGYTVNTGGNEKYASGWNRVFGDAAETTTEKNTKPKKKKPKASAKKSKKK